MSDQDTGERTQGGARPGLAATLSALIPGAGQWYAGNPARAAVVASPLILLIIAAFMAWQGGAVGILEWLVRPTVLWALVAVNALLLIWRLFAVIDAYRLPGSARSDRWSVVLLGLAVVIVVVPHVVAGAYVARGALLIDRVFVSAESGDVTPVTLAPPSPVADLVPDPATVATTTTEPPTTTTVELRSAESPVFRPDRGEADGARVPLENISGRLTFLIAGGDAGPGRGGLRTDTIMVATVDLETGEAALFGIPRNMGQIPMPPRFKNAFSDLERRLAPEGSTAAPCHCFPEQINALYPYTRKWTQSFPDEVDPGMAALRDVVAHMTGLPIDYYVLVDMQAFVSLVDAVGGVDVYVKDALQAEVSPPSEGQEWATVDVQPGWNHLSATEALAYARARKGSSDYVRMQRQRCLLRAVAGQADLLTLLRSFPAIAGAFERYVVTDVPVTLLPDLVRAASNLDFASIATVGFNPPYYAPERDHKYHPIPDLGRIRSKVNRVLEEGVIAQSKTGTGILSGSRK